MRAAIKIHRKLGPGLLESAYEACLTHELQVIGTSVQRQKPVPLFYEGVKLDWDLYSTLVPDDGVITLHDTVNYRPPCGVPQLVQEIREEGKYSVINFPIKYGTAMVKRNPVRG